MGYRCPVCGDPQTDDVHLANHLAFTAIARGGDHETWLDERVPGWGEMGESDLATQVRDLADSAEYPAVFEDTTGREHGHGHPGLAHKQEDDQPEGQSHEHDHGQQDGRPRGETSTHERPEMAEPAVDASMDEETRAVVEQARELTRQRRANAADSDEPRDTAHESDGTDATTGSKDGQ